MFLVILGYYEVLNTLDEFNTPANSRFIKPIQIYFII